MRKSFCRGLGAAVDVAVLGTVLGMVLTTAATAQEKPADFPQRPLNIVVMYPPGGGMDVTARTFAKIAEPQMDVSMRVENRVGGGGMVGHTSLAKETEPDGYTIGLLANPFLYTDILLRDAPFTIEEFEPFAEVSFDAVVFVVNAKSDIGDMTFDEMMERASTEPLQVGINPNSVFQFVAEFIAEAKGAEFNFIPFDGGKAGVVALLAGDVDATTAFYSEIAQYVESGDLKPVAISGDDRNPLMPDVPTLTELGVPVGGKAWGVTRYFTVPPGTPEDRKAWLEAEFLEVMASPEAKEAFTAAGLMLEPAGAAETKQKYQESFDALKKFLIESGRISG
ncbi:MAG: tripartite tricarboxylate transporter substrate binding protein [Gemmatimonadetes bacterium]|nr:tripartite tricarboxylate transporter substrate binding protein [Gemmatimonadota bacterium]